MSRRPPPGSGAPGPGDTGGSAGDTGDPTPPPEWRRRTWLRRILSVVVVLLALGVVARLVPVPYVVLRPGPVVDVLGAASSGAPMVAVTDAKEYPTAGSLYFTTVAEYGGPGRDLSAWEWVGAHLDPHAEVLPRASLYPPDTTREAVKAENTAAMTGSQEEAAAVALRALGRTVRERAVVAHVQPGLPADGTVRAKDVVESIDGTRVTAAADVARLVRATKPGASVRLGLVRGTQRIVVTLPTRQLEGRAVVGVSLRPEFTLPVKVRIDPGDVGGPSAGLVFALAVYDRLTPGALLRGQRIAGTGAVVGDGTVFPIGGIRQKMAGARRSGITWFLAPGKNCGEVAGAVPDGLTVVRVDTFAQAKDAVEEIAAGRGAGLRRCAA